MASRRRPTTALNIWPGFVDALSALLLLLVFVVMIFTLAQVFLAQTLANRDTQLDSLSAQLADIAAALRLEQTSNEDLRSALQDSQDRGSELIEALDALQAQSDADQARLAAERANNADLEAQLSQRNERLDELGARLDASRQSLDEERTLSASARAEVERLSAAIAQLRTQLDTISAALAREEALRAERETELADLGERLNIVLAERVNELEQYRSEFFGRLRQVLVDNPDIRIEGDRFVLPSELFFDSASATLGDSGRVELTKVAATLTDITAEMPDDLNWILRIDGHTDARPISTERFPSNWELSTARAVSVVRFLADQGIPPERLAATGFGEHHPLDPANTEAAFQRNRRIEIKLTER
ncbi:peptidoglycan -binding protein [Saccharospirillum mangrovi]|uniref:peptidoglycan -binding protein n=1 Tax=Saccharospirillum mangrovi TaxID=2161747 RepID=UPI000D383E9E|nr:peptidoglycan -binding protein [Saccharospirillum mangrovi]